MKILKIVTVTLFVLSLALYLGTSFRYNVVMDRVEPRIQCESEVLEVSIHATEEELLAGVTAKDNRDGDLTDKIMIQGISRLLSADTARITYVVADGSDNLASCTRTLRYVDYESPRITISEQPVYPLFSQLSEMETSLSVIDVMDGDISEQIVISSQKLDTGTEGAYILTIQITNSLGDAQMIPLTIVIDDEGAVNPLITLREYITYVSVGDDFSPRDYILTVNGEDFAGSYPALRIHSNLDTTVPGAYQVCYQYSDFTVYQTVVVR